MANQSKEELRKSLEELEFSTEEIKNIITKAEAEGKFSDEEKKDDSEEEDDKKKDTETVDETEMKKSYDSIVGMKKDIDKAISDFCDKYGSMPGVKTPDTDISKKGMDDDFNKSITDSIEKSIDNRFSTLQEQISAQATINQDIIKALGSISDNVKAMAEAPNPFKGIRGAYQILEKGGDKTNEDGKTVVSLRNKSRVTDLFQKSIDKLEDPVDKQIVNNMISTYTISGLTNQEGLNIVRKAMDIEFEK